MAAHLAHEVVKPLVASSERLLYDPENPPQGITPTPGTLYSEDVW